MEYKDISVVVSGPVYKEWTYETINSIKKILPGAEIIFSTWEGENTEGLNVDCVVFNKDPGNFEILDEEGGIAINNLNRQIVSTRQGILRASNKFVLKIRAESIIRSDNFLQYWDKYSLYDQKYKFVKSRIIAVWGGRSASGHRYVFNICDWYFFGYKEDILNLWDIPLLGGNTFFRGPKVDGRCSYLYNMHEENYLAVSFANKYINVGYFIDDREELNRKWVNFLVNNFVCTGLNKYGITSLKHPVYSIFKHELTNNYYGYTDIGWSRLYNELLGGHLQISYNLPYVLRNYVYLRSKLAGLRKKFYKEREKFRVR